MVYLMMMGLDMPETCRGWGKILRIICASSWFFFTRLYREAQSTKLKICSSYWQQGFSADKMFYQQQGFSY